MRLAAAFALVLAAGCAPVAAPGAAEDAPAAVEREGRVLVFTATEGYRHDSIGEAVATLRELGDAQGLEIVHSEDAADFNADNLAGFRAVVFANTTGEVLGEDGRAAMQAFVEQGGGFLGIHSAADTGYEWPWYGELVGAWFHSHPPGLQTARVTFSAEGIVEDGRTWEVTDEFYNFRDNPRGRVQVIATLQGDDYEGSTMGEDHPIAWCHRPGAGRAWYTGLGHDPALYRQAPFLRHLERGLRYATGLDAGC